METKLQYKYYVQQKFGISESQLNFAISNMKRRHPLEDWLVVKKLQKGRTEILLRLEFVQWLDEVYYNSEGFYLDREINFFIKQINRLEDELKISPRKKMYKPCLKKELEGLFNKSRKTIHAAVKKMEETNASIYVTKQDNKIIISAEGVKWLTEKYFRKEYLYELEIYKILLQRKKRELEDGNKQS